jgi:hypothetical protein
MTTVRGRALFAGSLPLLLALALVAPRPAGAAPAAVDNCYACHAETETPEGVKFKADVHYRAGVSCADCHGGDRTADDQDAAMNRAKGFRGKIRKADIPVVCGRCHGGKADPFQKQFHLTNVADSLSAGVHGEALRVNENGPQCVSCHGVHDIAAVADPRSLVHP